MIALTPLVSLSSSSISSQLVLPPYKEEERLEGGLEAGGDIRGGGSSPYKGWQLTDEGWLLNNEVRLLTNEHWLLTDKKSAAYCRCVPLIISLYSRVCAPEFQSVLQSV